MLTGTVRLHVTIDGLARIVTTRCSQPCAHILTVHTVLPEPPFALEIHSTFIGHPDIATHAKHLVLGPIGAAPTIREAEHDQAALQPGVEPGGCVYEHVATLVDVLTEHGHHARIKPPAVNGQLLFAGS